jgi:hypothetical protein
MPGWSLNLFHRPNKINLVSLSGGFQGVSLQIADTFIAGRV